MIPRRPRRTAWSHTCPGSAGLSPRTGLPSSDGGAATGSTSVGPFSTRRSSRTLVDHAAQALDAGDHPRAASIAKEALGLWHGPVLADVTLHLESRAEAERLDELRLRAFEIRVDADLALGRHAELVGELRRLVEETPYRERLVAQLMVALYRSGRHVEALEVYERTRRDLEDDLGLRPGEELQRLAGQIVRQEPHLRTPAQPVLARDGRPTRPRARRLSAIVLAGALAVAVTAVAHPPVRPDRCRLAGLQGLDSGRPDPNVGSRRPRHPRRSGLGAVCGRGFWKPSAITSSRPRSSTCSRAAHPWAASSRARKKMSTGFLRGSGPVTSISCCGLLGSRGRGSSTSSPSTPARVSSSSTTAVRRGSSSEALPMPLR